MTHSCSAIFLLSVKKHVILDVEFCQTPKGQRSKPTQIFMRYFLFAELYQPTKYDSDLRGIFADISCLEYVKEYNIIFLCYYLSTKYAREFIHLWEFVCVFLSYLLCHVDDIWLYLITFFTQKVNNLKCKFRMYDNLCKCVTVQNLIKFIDLHFFVRLIRFSFS